MTSYKSRRCIHCKTKYEQLASGFGYLNTHNDSRYCPECLSVVNRALSQVPKLFEMRCVDVTSISQCSDVTLEQVLEWKAAMDQDIARRRAEGQCIGVRVAAPLFDLNNPENINIASYVVPNDGPFKGVSFILSTWLLSDDYTIRVEVEWDLKKDEFHDFWRNYW